MLKIQKTIQSTAPSFPRLPRYNLVSPRLMPPIRAVSAVIFPAVAPRSYAWRLPLLAVVLLQLQSAEKLGMVVQSSRTRNKILVPSSRKSEDKTCSEKGFVNGEVEGQVEGRCQGLW